MSLGLPAEGDCGWFSADGLRRCRCLERNGNGGDRCGGLGGSGDGSVAVAMETVVGATTVVTVMGVATVTVVGVTLVETQASKKAVRWWL